MIAYYRVLGLIGLVFSLVVGCAPQKSAPSPATPKAKKMSYTQQIKRTVPAPQYNKSSQAVANRLEQIAKRVPHVRGATAVSLGKYAIVALDVDPKLDRGRVGTIKYSVAEALRKDPVGARALVTADVDLLQRLKNVKNDIVKGHPVAGIMQELAAIAERITPQPSTNVVPKRTTSK